MSYINENNAERPATRKQLWAIYCLSKVDYRGQDLTMADASNLIKRLQSEKGGVSSEKRVSRKKNLESEFIEFMTKQMQGVIETAKEALQIKSVLEDDPNIFKNPSKRKQFAFVGFGCGFTIIDFDKRSKVGKEIIELSKKHRMSTFLNMFLKGFTKKEIEYYEKIGCPLTALYYQDIRISGNYHHSVIAFMREKGVKNVSARTYDD